ncbi:MAG TPA: hypothetical protein VIH59_20240, partial [Candidatus Tectomicrobia bacterium]
RTGNILPAVVDRLEAETLWVRWQGHILATLPQSLPPGTPVYLCIRPTQILIVRSERLFTRQRENLLSGTIVRESMQAEAYTLYFRLEHSHTTYDLEISLPGYVYHRLCLDTDKRLMVELSRQALHVMPCQTEALVDGALSHVPLTPLATMEEK